MVNNFGKGKRMIWLGTCQSYPEISTLLDNHEIGLMCQPLSDHPRVGWVWAADNGCFSAKEWDEGRWYRWLSKRHPRAGCLFATVPDVVADHKSTMDLWRKYHDRVRDLRYPTAFVAQNGAVEANVPWSDLDALFIGGDTAYKQGPVAASLAQSARERGKWVHVGRVNSFKRLSYWAPIADSADGTFLAYSPVQNAARVKEWVDRLRSPSDMKVEAV